MNCRAMVHIHFKRKEGRRMPPIRQDAWSHDEDVRLAETILKHIRTGSTQLAGFAEAGTILSRTPAACGFRWNSTVRRQYAEALTSAKEARKISKKQKKKAVSLPKKENRKNDETIISKQAIRQTIEFLHQLSKEVAAPTGTQETLERLRTENDELVRANRRLEKRYAELKENYTSMLQALKIVDQARRQIPEMTGKIPAKPEN